MEDRFLVTCPYCGEEVEIYVEPDLKGSFVRTARCAAAPGKSMSRARATTDGSTWRRARRVGVVAGAWLIGARRVPCTNPDVGEKALIVRKDVRLSKPRTPAPRIVVSVSTETGNITVSSGS
jgi:hypothetical protein